MNPSASSAGERERESKRKKVRERKRVKIGRRNYEEKKRGHFAVSAAGKRSEGMSRLVFARRREKTSGVEGEGKGDGFFEGVGKYGEGERDGERQEFCESRYGAAGSTLWLRELSSHSCFSLFRVPCSRSLRKCLKIWQKAWAYVLARLRIQSRLLANISTRSFSLFYTYRAHPWPHPTPAGRERTVRKTQPSSFRGSEEKREKKNQAKGSKEAKEAHLSDLLAPACSTAPLSSPMISLSFSLCTLISFVFYPFAYFTNLLLESCLTRSVPFRQLVPSPLARSVCLFATAEYTILIFFPSYLALLGLFS